MTQFNTIFFIFMVFHLCLASSYSSTKNQNQKEGKLALDYAFSDESKQILINKLRKKFQSHINDLIFHNNKSNIHQNHVEFLRLRNVECPKEFAKIDDVMISSKNSSWFTKSLEKWAAFSEDLNSGFEDEIVDDLNKIVIDYFY